MFIDFLATEVALITTNSSKYGPNAMAFEWTMQIAYDPILIAIFIHESLGIFKRQMGLQ